MNQLKIIYYAAKDFMINIKYNEYQATRFTQSHVCEHQLNR